MKKLMILAVAAIALVACSRTFEHHETQGAAIGFGTWTETMTKTPKTDFAANDEFDIYGFKWNTGPANQTNVFTGDDVKYDGSKWTYSPIRFWDKNFDNYTFYAVFPKNQLDDEAVENDYAQKGLFISNDLTYDGSSEKLLVAQKKTVANASYGTTVPLVFKHAGALVDIKFKKHTNLATAKVDVTSISLSDIQIKGYFTVASYDASDNPVGATVSGVAGLGWALASPSEVNATPAATPYLNSSTVTLAKDAGVGTANAANLISNLVVMPQVLGKTSGPKITISYTITTDPGGSSEETFSYADKPVYFGEFDLTDPDPTDKGNTDPRVANWMPGTHYTYYITINANAIEFSASISPWNTTEVTGHYYLIY